MQNNDARRGHGFDQLIRADGVGLEGEIGEHDKPAEGDGDGDHLGNGEDFRGEDAQETADDHSQSGEDEVDAGHGHVGEVVVGIDSLVEHDDGNGQGDVKGQAHGNEGLAPLLLGGVGRQLHDHRGICCG